MLPFVDQPRFFVQALASDPDAAVTSLKVVFPEDVSHWDVTMREDGSSAYIGFPCLQDDPLSVETRLGVLFGNKRASDLATDTNGN